MWVQENANPLKNHVGDCVVRAISKATGKSWDRTFTEICVVAYDLKDMPDANRVWGEYLRQCGYKRVTIPNECPNCYTIERFCADHPQGNFVVAVEGHVVCVIDGNHIDTWDSSQEVPIFYWEV